MLLKIYKTCLKPSRGPVKTLQGLNGSYTKKKCWCWLIAYWFPCTLFKYFLHLLCVYICYSYLCIYICNTYSRSKHVSVNLTGAQAVSFSGVWAVPSMLGCRSLPAFPPTAETWDFTRDRWAEVWCRQCLEEENRRCSWETRHEKLPWVKAKVDGGVQSDGKQITETGKESCPGQ